MGHWHVLHVRRWLCAIAAGMATCFAGAAQASQTLSPPGSTFGVETAGYVNASVNGGGPTQKGQTNDWQQAAPQTLDLSLNNAGDVGTSASASMHLSAGYGLLAASGQGGATGTHGGGAGASVIANGGGAPGAQFADRINLYSHSLADGTQVRLRFTLVFTGNVAASPSVSGDIFTRSSLWGSLFASSGIGVPGGFVDSDRANLTVGASTNLSYTSMQTGIMDGVIGSYINLHGQLFVETEANSNSGAPPGDSVNSSFSYDGSIATYIEVLGIAEPPAPSDIASFSPFIASDTLAPPDVYFIADSGATYTPEPSSVAVMGLLTLGGLLVLPRRRRVL